LLQAWAPERKLLRQLAQLSEHLVDFPQIDLPLTSQPIHQQFPGEMELNYLAVQFSTRRSPGLSAREQLQITCLRTWLLLRALEFAEVEHCPDRSLRHLSTQLRMALDDRDSGQKLAWFLAVLEPALTVQGFELALRRNLHKAEASAAGKATTAETIRSLQALLDNRRRPEPCNQNFDWGSVFAALGSGLVSQADASDFVMDDLQADGSLYLPADEEEEELRFQEADVGVDDTPPEVIRESRGIVFQSQEDQQYLPFAWNRLRADELTALKIVIGERLLSPNPADRLLAAVTFLALVTRRSMETIESLPLASVNGEEWQLDPAEGRLHRLPSRRAVRWRADDVTRTWIHPLADGWVLQLHPPMLGVLQSASQQHPEARSVGQLWTGQDISLASAFNRWCSASPDLARVSSGLLVRLSEQAAFEQTLDPTFARLVTSPSRAGIAGAGAYPSWSHGQVAQTMNLMCKSFATMALADPNRNGLGSELDPDDGMLAAAMAQAREQLCALAGEPTRWLEYHNHMVAYGVLMLLAATGARPVNSVFQTSKQLDLSLGQIYLEDKVVRSGQDGTSGRLVPLVSAVTEFLTHVYFPYLRHLADEIRPRLPAFANELDQQANGSGSDVLPLFFLLRSRPEFDWLEVSESSLHSLGLLTWPLPLNLFRHRLASRLRTMGLDPELIDAQLGHAEAGSETFSDTSPRCWDTEQAVWRRALEQSFDRLSILPPVLARPTVNSLRLPPGYQPFPDESLFGRQARARERAARRSAAAQRAFEEIRTFVGTRPVDAIAPQEWERLGRQMLLTDNNLRQPNASVRYQVYEDYLQSEWRSEGRRPRLRKWLAQLPRPQSTFRADVIGVTGRLDAVRDALDKVHGQLTFPLSKRLAAILAALDLCVIGRVTALEVVQALAHADTERVRLIIFEQKAYAEYSEVLTKVESPPVLRYALPSRSARLADRALSAGKQLDAFKELPPELVGVARAARLSSGSTPVIDELLQWLTQQVEQENARCLPGVVTAVLAARLTCYALPWEDWMRVRSSQARRPLSPDRLPQEPSDEDFGDSVVIHRSPIGLVLPSEREGAKVANRKFLREIREALTRYLDRSSATEGPSAESTVRHHRTNTDSSARRDTRTAIQKILQKPDAAVSVAIHALGMWTLHLLYRPYRKGLLDAASIKRYLDALAYGFLSFGYELDLADLDGDELTEFYRCVVEEGRETANDANEKMDEASVGSTAGRNQKYVLQRMAEFHRFAQSRYGLEAVDWSEIGDGLLGSVAHPGTVTEAEYLHALQALCSQPFGTPAHQVRDAFILLLAYRFGLRGGEAIGLRRGDWVNIAGSIVVLVSSRHRQLKTRSSQRQVPLLEPLTEHEEKVIQRWLAHWSTETGDDPAVSLFFDETQRRRVADMGPIRQRLIAALRAATCSNHTTLHHARHAFANRMGLHLIARSPAALWSAHQTCDPLQAEAIQRSTLLTIRESRRAPWVIARLLGHATPKTTFSSYLHLQLDWAIQHVQARSPEYFASVPRRKLKATTDLDTWHMVDDYLSRAPVQTLSPAQPCTPSSVLKFCRLRAQGMPARSAGEHCLLASTDWLRIEEALVLSGRKLAPALDAKQSDVATIVLAQVLLGHIQRHRWPILIDYVVAQEKTAAASLLVQDTEAIGQQVGKTRQLLLWTRRHFLQLRQVMDWLQLTDEHVALFRPAKLDARLVQWSSECGFADLQQGRSADGRKALQIDVALELRSGAPDIVHPNRVAAVPTAANPIAKSSFEFLLIWLAVRLAGLAVREQAGGGCRTHSVGAAGPGLDR
jgi:integrase